MKRFFQQRAACIAAILLILAVTIVSGLGLNHAVAEVRRREAENVLFYYREKILLQLKGTMNEAGALAQTAYYMEKEHVDSSDWFRSAAKALLKRPEVRMVCRFDGDVLADAMPGETLEKLEGGNLQDFSYIYTLAKVVKELVVEGPVAVDNLQGQPEVFLFLQPIVENNAYLGQVVVALDRDYVLKELGIVDLHEQGYDYELWRVDPQNGNKEVIAASRTGTDFSQAQKTNFYLPAQWTLSIQPAGGWVSPRQRAGLLLGCVLLAFFLSAIMYLLCRSLRLNREFRKTDLIDRATGLYNRNGFTAALEEWLGGGESAVMLYYFSMDGYVQAARRMGPEKENEFLRSIPARLGTYIHGTFLAGRLDAGSYAVAVRDEMDETQREDFAKGLSLELMLQVRIHGEKRFLMARYQYICCRPGEKGAKEVLSELIQTYCQRVDEESPIRSLTEKCRELIEGKDDVVFDEYTDMEMMELSKTFNRYRKQVEQLAYTDPVFGSGNRLKFMRDSNMLISYDEKREFGIYCIDICSFSQYNELFSASIGDEILHEVLRRLSRPFGSNLYRINGDVFLGICLSGESPASLAARLQEMFNEPITVGTLSFPLQIRIAVCLYPEHGKTPGELLDHIQSALRFAKTSDRTVTIYNDQLDEIIRTEADILRRLKDSIREGTLEVWYQPIMRLEAGCYTAMEALVRLPDGKGGYYSAGQVISLAESNGIVEELGDYVLFRACEFMRTRGIGLGIRRMGVNLSVQQLLVGNSAGHLLEIIQRAGLEPCRITLEITESILIQSIDGAAKALERLREAGIHIALDDFGVGYSSLNYLSNLPVDIIKIDRSLTKQILINNKQHALLKSIVEMAAINGLLIVAEGVETDAEQEIIAGSGVQYIQGYYYARPMKGEVLDSFLKEQVST